MPLQVRSQLQPLKQFRAATLADKEPDAQSRSRLRVIICSVCCPACPALPSRSHIRCLFLIRQKPNLSVCLHQCDLGVRGRAPPMAPGCPLGVSAGVERIVAWRGAAQRGRARPCGSWAWIRHRLDLNPAPVNSFSLNHTPAWIEPSG